MGLLGKDRNRERFVEKGLEYITRDDGSYSHFFKDQDGGRLSDDIYRERRSMLEEALGEAYEHRAREKLKPGFSNYLATGLRALAGANYAAGTALFLTMPGPVGFGFTGIGAGVSLLADAIDSHYYHKKGLIKGGSLTDARIATESVAEKGLGYLPIGTGLVDLYRGRRKFKNAAMANIIKDEDVVSYAISKFASKLYQREGGEKMIPLSALRDHRYHNQEASVSTAA